MGDQRTAERNRHALAHGRIAIDMDDTGLAARLAGTLGRPHPGRVGLDDASVILLPVRSVRAQEVERIRWLLAQYPAARVIVVVSGSGAAVVRKALGAGAHGVINESDVDAVLESAVAAVTADLLCLPVTYRRQLAPPTFTTRERQILGLVIMGLSNGEISRRLFLAESTVKSHLSSAFSKLGVRSRNEATAMILDPSNGLGPGILTVREQIAVPESVIK